MCDVFITINFTLLFNYTNRIILWNRFLDSHGGYKVADTI